MLKIALIFVAALLALTPLPRHAVERTYSRGLYPIIQPKLTALTNSTPFAWFDAVVLLTLAATVALWTIRLRNRKTGIVRTLGGLVFDTGAIGAVLYLWFLGSWGLNYQRQPLREQLDFREDRITREALGDLAGRTVHSLNTLHARAHSAGWPDVNATPDALDAAFVQTQRDLALPWTAQWARPKRTLLNFYFTRVSIDGMTNPFFLETLTNQTLLPFERAATVAHEWSHLAGYADESEANFVGWLVCMRGTEPLQYSGWLSLYGTIVNALPRSDRNEIAARLDPGPRTDLRAISARIDRYQIRAASRAGYALYDRFLKANRVEAGVRSYGEVLRLLLGTKFNEDGSPVLRRKGYGVWGEGHGRDLCPLPFVPRPFGYEGNCTSSSGSVCSMFVSSDAGLAVVAGARRAFVLGALARGALGRAAARRGARRALRLAVRFALRLAARFAVFLFDAVLDIFLTGALRDLAAFFAVFLRFLAMRAP